MKKTEYNNVIKSYSINEDLFDDVKKTEYNNVIKSYSINEDLFDDVKKISKLKKDMLSKLIQKMFTEYVRDNEELI